MSNIDSNTMTHTMTYSITYHSIYTIVTKNETGKPADVLIWPTDSLKTEMSAMDMWNHIANNCFFSYLGTYCIHLGKIVNVYSFLAKRYNRYYVKGEHLDGDVNGILHRHFGGASVPNDNISEFLESFSAETIKIGTENRVPVKSKKDYITIGSKSIRMVDIVDTFEKYLGVKIPECSISENAGHIVLKESAYFVSSTFTLSGAFVLSIMSSIPKKIGDLAIAKPEIPAELTKNPVTEKIFGTNKLTFINGNLQVDENLAVLHKIIRNGVVINYGGNKIVLERCNLLTSYIEDGKFRMIFLNGTVYDVAVLHPKYKYVLEKLDRKMNKFIN